MNVKQVSLDDESKFPTSTKYKGDNFNIARVGGNIEDPSLK